MRAVPESGYGQRVSHPLAKVIQRGLWGHKERAQEVNRRRGTGLTSEAQRWQQESGHWIYGGTEQKAQLQAGAAQQTHINSHRKGQPFKPSPTST